MKSLGAQLVLRLLLGGVLLLSAAGTAAYWQVRRALAAEFDATLRATAQSLSALAEQRRGHVTLELAPGSMPQFEPAKGGEVFVLRAEDGREIVRSPSLGGAALPAGPSRAGEPEYFDAPMPDGRTLRGVGVRFTPPEEDEGEDKPGAHKVEAVLVVGRDRAPLEHTLATLRTSLLLAGGGALALLVALVAWSVRSGLAPLGRLGEQVAAVEAESLSRRLPIEPLPTELQPIAARLNELLARLEAAFARERRFTATAAHELRTPLAELRAVAEVNLMTPATEAERSESWRDALKTILRMESLALRLLELARAEHGGPGGQRRPLPLREMLGTAWQPWARRAAERGVSMEERVPAELRVQADAEVLGLIIGNLCANAAEYALADTPLRVHATTEDGAVRVHFQNQTENLTAADLPHLFERFWRKDEARADGKRHGLGLALAVEYAGLMGAQLSARVNESREVDFELRLPQG